MTKPALVSVNSVRIAVIHSQEDRGIYETLAEILSAVAAKVIHTIGSKKKAERRRRENEAKKKNTRNRAELATLWGAMGLRGD